MMPGETPPAASLAGEAATACASCGALQQNLNEYVAALIALKQKIIDTDHLLTEYQQKCNELDAAKRENNTLHNQVEQMFQKISPLEKCEEELGSVKAELEEKKSSLKIYQETHLEYVRLKEEMDKSDITRRKLDTKVKKLEEAAAKHIQEFKQLKTEKKVLAKQLKKAQEKISGFAGATRKKRKTVLKNAETQSEEENLVASIDKEKIKLLLEELWMCISGSTGKDQISENDCILGGLRSNSRTLGKTKMMPNPPKMKKPQGEMKSDGSFYEPCAVEMTLSSLHIKSDTKTTKYSESVQIKPMETTEVCNSTFCEDRLLEDISQTDLSTANMNLLSNNSEEHDESLRDVLKWARPLPPLLSPIQVSPSTTPDILFGDITDSSDDEMDDNAQILENIIENYGQDGLIPESRHEKHSAQSWSTHSSFSINSANSDPQESPKRLSNIRSEELILCSDPLKAKAKYLNEKDAKSKDEEKYSDLMEVHTATEIAVQKMSVNSTVHTFVESSDSMDNEKKGLLTATIEDFRPQSPKISDQHNIKESIFVVESISGIPEKCKIDVSKGAMSEVFKDTQPISNSVEVRSFGERTTECLAVGEQNTATEGLGICRSSELLLEQKRDISNCKFLSETEHPIEQEIAAVPFMHSVEKKVDVSIKSQCLEENCSKEKHYKQNETQENTEHEVMHVGFSSSHLNTTEIAEGSKKSLFLIDEAVKTEGECRITFSVSTKKDDNQVEIANSMVEECKSMDIKKEDCLQLHQLIDQKYNCKTSKEQPDYKSNCILPVQAPIIKDCLLPCKDPVATNTLVFQIESVPKSTSKQGQFEGGDTDSQWKSKMRSVSNDLPTVKASMEGDHLASKGLEKEDGESLNTIEMKTMQSVMAQGNAFEIASNRIVETSLISGNQQYEINNTSHEMSNWNSKSTLCHQNDEKNDVCSITKEMLLKQNKNQDPAQSMQDAPQTNNEDIETVLPATVMADSQSAAEHTDVSSSNLEVFIRDGPSSNAATNALSSSPVSINPSTPVRQDTTHFDQNIAECWKNEEEYAAASEEKEHESLDCCSPSNNKDEESLSKPQALITLKGSCSRENYKALTPGTSNLNSFHTRDVLLANKSVLSDEKPLIPDKKLMEASENTALEHTQDDTTDKETDKMLSHKSSEGVGTIKVSEHIVMVMNSSVSVASSAEKYFPLRKVQFRRTSTVPLAKIETVRNSQAGTASNTILSVDGQHEVAPQKENQVPGDGTDSCANEAVQRTWDHSYSVGMLCSNENAPLKLKATISKEKSEGRLEEESISIITPLQSQRIITNRKTDPGKPSVSDLEIKSNIITSDNKCSDTSLETSITQLHFSKGKSNAEQCSTNLEQNHLTSHHVDDSSNISHNKECHVQNNGKTSVLKNGAEQIHIPSDAINVAEVKGDDNRLFQKKRKSRHSLTETIVPSADTSTPTRHYPKTLTKIMQEMGPPLPPLLGPLMATPPRTVRPLSPRIPLSRQSSLTSSLDGLTSPSHQTPIPAVQLSPVSDTLKCNSPAPLTTPSPCEMPVGQRILSSPLQFCATTPKHALPVPGRFPPSAAGVAAPPVLQENSVKILDSMYPELSARARTLSILKGIQLSKSSSVDGKNIPQPINQISGFKAISSTSTAFVKAGTKFTSDPEQPFCKIGETFKRTLSPAVVPKDAKRLKLDNKSSNLELEKKQLSDRVSDANAGCHTNKTDYSGCGDGIQSTGGCDSEFILAVEKINETDSRSVTIALEKISEACFDLLPVIRSHVFVGNTSRVPVMRDEEKEVVHELCVTKKKLAEPALQAILNKLKHEKMSLNHNCMQALCRVYVGICRQLGDLERARLFCYSLLKEGFPKSDRLILFIANVWTDVFSSEGVISKAIQSVARQRARGNVRKCLSFYLNWEESAPVDIGVMVSSLLLAIQLCPQMEFQFSEEYGEDLKESTWEYVFAIVLLCSHQKWRWTHDNIISKELWPIMDKWIKNRKGTGSASSPSDIIVATVFRLIGHLGQIGLKEGFYSAVENISSVIGVFLQHSKEKDVAWGVQLAAAYALCDLGPSNPSKILEAICTWEAMNTNSLPAAVANAVAELRRLSMSAGRTEESHQRNTTT
uniref:Interactor of little elongation complex ELL subunit 1 n=1 Tax=Anolis carolinensis TaxID=28377 RepID=A0A803TI34_ANOCA|nr:PREDICTED: little elongation complex subunit 1 isoform X1 [Anolis carolinensis]|eukprot:XP_008113261.1 PREDICTED: little elongation complex subunit 1 isoform X1 [Anolis carolinensis]